MKIKIKRTKKKTKINPCVEQTKVRANEEQSANSCVKEKPKCEEKKEELEIHATAKINKMSSKHTARRIYKTY